MAEDKFYVGISEPDEVRKYVLESSKAMITTLKRYEAFKKTRMEKAELIAKFNQILKQISILSNRLRKQFPEAGIRVPTLNVQTEQNKVQAGKKVGAKAAVGRPEQMMMQKKVEKTELQRLEEELLMIERKLNAI